MKSFLVVIVAISAVTGLAFFAASKGIDGVMLSSAFTVIGGLAGYDITKRVITKHKGKGKR